MIKSEKFMKSYSKLDEKKFKAEFSFINKNVWSQLALWPDALLSNTKVVCSNQTRNISRIYCLFATALCNSH